MTINNFKSLIMHDEKIFNLITVEDLPADVKHNISRAIPKKQKPRPNTMQNRIASLFSIKEILTINEIIVGLYRKYDVIKGRASVISCLYTLCRSNKIKKIGRGTYERGGKI